MKIRKRVAIKRAVGSVIEFLEERRLLSASAQISDTTSANVANDVAFNSISTGHSGAAASRIETVTLTDTGASTLTFPGGAFNVVADPSTSDSSGNFKIINLASQPASLAPGASTVLQLQYTATIVGLQSALLQISSNDPITPTLTINLHGIGTPGQFGVLEPSLGQVLRAHNIPTIIGAGFNDASLNTQKYPINPDASSQEVPMQRLVAATAGQPVTITPIASFSTATAAVSRIGYYTPGDPANSTELFYIGKADAQVVDPTALGATTFDPGAAPFSLYGTFPGTTTPNGSLDTHYSEDSLNVLDPTHERKIRFFPMKTSAGAVVPNTFVVAMEDYNDPTTYNSFINFVGIISNVKAAPNATAGSTPSSPAAGNPPVMGVVENQPAPGSTTLVFNTIRTVNAILPDVVHNTNTVTINNSGDQPLIINSLILSDTKNWTLVNPPAPGTSIAAGASLTVTIQFIATSDPSHPSNETNDVKSGSLVSVQAAGGVWKGTLTINSNDSINPTRTVNLAGYWQIETEHENEPGVATLTNLLLGYTTNDTGAAALQGTEFPNNGNTPLTYGSEVDPSTNQGLLVAADPSQPVGLIEVAAFHQQYVTTDATVGMVTVEVVTASESGTTATLTTTIPHGFKVGQSVTVLGVSVAAYNGTFTITAVPSATTFSYTAPSSGLITVMTQPTSPQSGYYNAGSANSKYLFRDQPNNGQSVFPMQLPDSFSTVQSTFSPAGAFGLSLDGEKSQDSINAPVDTPFNTSGHAIRFFPILDANGNPIPNDWVVGMDYRNYAGPNSDYQDLFMILTNATFESMPAAPIDLKATQGTSGANLQWAPVNGATGYNVYSSVNGGAMTKITASPITSANYTDTTTTAGQSVVYQVTAVNASGESLPNKAAINVATAPPPTAPTNVVADGTSGTQVTLTWTSVAGATSYIVSREDPDASSFTQIAAGITATNYTDMDVTAGSTYQYVVQAQGPSGTSPVSAAAPGMVVIMPPPPIAPTNLQGQVMLATEVGLTWSVVPSATTYNVDREGPGETSFTQIATGLMTNSYTDVGLTPNNTYIYEVQAQNSIGVSPFSDPKSVPVPPYLPPPASPIMPNVDASSGTQVVLTWNIVSGASTYNVLREDPGQTSFTQIASGLMDVTYADTNITPLSTYQYEIEAQNAAGPSLPSPSVSVTVPPPPPGTPATPTNLMAAVSGTSIVLTWIAAASDSAYDLLRESPTSNGFVDTATGLTSTTFTDTNIVAGVDYQYEVLATNASLSSPSSAPVAAKLPIPPAMLPVTIGKGANKSVQFTDTNGTVATITLTGPGMATVNFTAISISQNIVRGASIVTGVDVAIASISTTGTTGGSNLTVKTKGGNGTTSIGGISADSALGHITAKTSTLIGTLTTAGGISMLSLGSANAAAITVGGALKSFQINTATGVSVMATGAIQKIQASTWNSTGMISAPSINMINILGPATIDVNTAVLHTLKVRGALTGSQLTLTGAGTMDLASLSAGSIFNTVIDASGNLGAIAAGSLIGSRIDAGVASSVVLPSSPSDFIAPSSISSVTLKKTSGVNSLVNSSIAASVMKKASLGNLQLANGGTPFGVVAQTINSLTFVDPAIGKSSTFNRLSSESIVTADLAAKGISPQDFVIRIV